MSWTTITKPVQGDATKKSLIDAVIDDLSYLYNQISSLHGLAVPNPSFEADVDADSLPDEWTRTLYTGGTFAITGIGLADTACVHGQRAVKFTSPGGAGNGGGYIESTDYIETTPNRAVALSWQMKSTAATIRNKVELLWYTGAQIYISTSTLYTSITNSLVWTPQIASAFPPSNALYCKIRLTGAENTTTVAGSCYFDDVRLLTARPYQNEITLTTPGAYAWTCPTGVLLVDVEVMGGGGGGGGGHNGGNGGSGGGGAGLSRKWYPVTPGTSYLITVGTGGGGGGVDTNGTTGGTSIFDTAGATPPTATGGVRGVEPATGSTGGVGGTGSNGDVMVTGGTGGSRSGGTGGNGGIHPNFGSYPVGATTIGKPGSGWGDGGAGGGGTSGFNGGDGSPGRITLRW